ncbi:flagellar basal body P-ring formation protein FlgA [Rhodobacterales bacterium LSUCC0031]|nr:flagellar basal body P-ring formation protein FlgA [Rhodobacterales bacterium LSUCC0031]
MRVVLAIIAVFLVANSAHAELRPPLTGADIAVVVREAMIENGQIGAPMLAEQRRYYPCETALSVAPRRAGRWDAVDVSCAGAIPWSIVVRTSVEVPAIFGFGEGERTGEMTNVVVPRHTLRRDEVITAEKLELVAIDSARASGTYSEIAPLIGRRMVQTLSAGVPVRERHMELAWSVREGDPIVIEANTGGMIISMAGIALENGQVGDFIEVRNQRSQKTVHGIVGEGKKIVVAANMN